MTHPHVGSEEEEEEEEEPGFWTNVQQASTWRSLLGTCANLDFSSDDGGSSSGGAAVKWGGARGAISAS